jgi:hypothetical protein
MKNNFPMDCNHPAYNMTNCNPGPVAAPVSIRVPICEQYNGTICAGVIEKNIYIPTGLTQVNNFITNKPSTHYIINSTYKYILRYKHVQTYRNITKYVYK